MFTWRVILRLNNRHFVVDRFLSLSITEATSLGDRFKDGGEMQIIVTRRLVMQNTD